MKELSFRVFTLGILGGTGWVSYDATTSLLGTGDKAPAAPSSTFLLDRPWSANLSPEPTNSSEGVRLRGRDWSATLLEEVP